MQKDADASIKSAAEELGVPEAALRLYISTHDNVDPEAASVDSSRLDALRNDLKQRTGALRLDDLAKTALTVEWLAQSAVSSLHKELGLVKKVDSLAEEVAEGPKAPDVTSLLAPITERVDSLDKQLSKLNTTDNSQALVLAASVQSMVEQQGREMDKIRSEVEELRKELKACAEAVSEASFNLAGLLDGLRSIVGPADSTPTASGMKQEKGAASGGGSAPTANAQVEEKTEPRFKNVPQSVQAKIGVKREIEYNFLLERMGFKRLDSYPSTFDGEIKLPSDVEIKSFLGQYELGCSVDEIAIVSVQRGEYQMIQYQRVDKNSNLKGWIPSKRK